MRNVASPVEEPDVPARERIGTGTPCSIDHPAHVPGRRTGAILQGFGYPVVQVENLKKNGIGK